MTVRKSNVLEAQTERCKRYCKNILGKKFCIDTELDDTAANAIALATIFGGGSEIWLNGELVNLKSLKLRITLHCQTEQEKI